MIRKLFIVVAVGFALLMQSDKGLAQETVQFARVVERDGVYDTSWAESDRMLVIIEVDGLGTTRFPSACGLGAEPLPNVLALVIHPGHKAEFLTIAIVSGTLREGDRLVGVSTDSCRCGITDAGSSVACGVADPAWHLWVSEATLASRGRSTPFLFTASGEPELGGDDQAIITGTQDEAGFAKVVISRKGEQPIRTALHADFQLEPSDRIVDIIELDYDPATGLSLYAAYVEY